MISPGLNPEMIVLAREYRDFTQKKLAELSGVGQSQIAMIEGGVENSASDETITRLSTALGFPRDFFFRRDYRIGFGSSSVYYRKSSSITAGDRKRISSLTNLSRMLVKQMLDTVEINSDLKLPAPGGVSPSEAANIVRAAWSLPDGPIGNLSRLVERAGIIIVVHDFGVDGLSGTSIKVSETPPIVFLNKWLPPDRFRFTLAHELGHLVLHDSPTEHMEDEADEFASELLMQKISFAANVKQFGRRPTLKEYSQLKPYWKVAISAMIMRSAELGIISGEEKRSLFIQMSKFGMRKSEEQPFEMERPTIYKKIVSAALEQMQITEQTASIYKMPLDVFTALLSSSVSEPPQKGPGLRLVA